MGAAAKCMRSTCWLRIGSQVRISSQREILSLEAARDQIPKNMRRDTTGHRGSDGRSDGSHPSDGSSDGSRAMGRTRLSPGLSPRQGDVAADCARRYSWEGFSSPAEQADWWREGARVSVASAGRSVSACESARAAPYRAWVRWGERPCHLPLRLYAIPASPQSSSAFKLRSFSRPGARGCEDSLVRALS